jgi:hypothetical protein
MRETDKVEVGISLAGTQVSITNGNRWEITQMTSNEIITIPIVHYGGVDNTQWSLSILVC